MKANDFVSRLYNIATTKKTVYAWGMFGSPITSSIVTGKAKQYPSWYTDAKINGIFAPLYGRTPTAWGFDCIGLIKAVLWGWEGNTAKSYGGAVYASNGVPDLSADIMIGRCSDISTDFNKISIGEFLWMKGHCGIYIGDGQVVESTPSWKNGVQITSLNARNWLKHGKLPWVEYLVKEVKNTVSIELSVLQKGSKGKQVKTLQRLLNSFGHNLDVDGIFGNNTDVALRSYQKSNKLEVDGICGGLSWRSLLK
jgi:peptidoglycan hydrolase-like protein with peptidoglycan-binding domain